MAALQVLVITCCLIYPGVYAVMKMSFGCFGSAGECLDHSLTCPDTSRIIIEEAVYGHKTWPNCTTGVIKCKDSCCNYDPIGDCFNVFKADDIINTYRNCTEHACHIRAPRTTTQCSRYEVPYQFISVYSVIEYQCVEEYQTIPFCGAQVTRTGNTISMIYDPRSQYKEAEDWCSCVLSNPTGSSVSIEGMDLRLQSDTTMDCPILILQTGDLYITRHCNQPYLWPDVQLGQSTSTSMNFHLTGKPEFAWLRVSADAPLEVNCKASVLRTTTTQPPTFTTTTTTTNYPTAPPVTTQVYTTTPYRTTTNYPTAPPVTTQVYTTTPHRTTTTNYPTRPPITTQVYTTTTTETTTHDRTTSATLTTPTYSTPYPQPTTSAESTTTTTSSSEATTPLPTSNPENNATGSPSTSGPIIGQGQEGWSGLVADSVLYGALGGAIGLLALILILVFTICLCCRCGSSSGPKESKAEDATPIINPGYSSPVYDNAKVSNGDVLTSIPDPGYSTLADIKHPYDNIKVVEKKPTVRFEDEVIEANVVESELADEAIQEKMEEADDAIGNGNVTGIEHIQALPVEADQEVEHLNAEAAGEVQERVIDFNDPSPLEPDVDNITPEIPGDAETGQVEDVANDSLPPAMSEVSGMFRM